MGYFDNYDYCEPSVLDELVDNTTDKIKDMIINETKETPKQSCYGNC